MKNVKKKLLTMMFLLVGASLFLAGCGSKSKKAETKNSSYSDEEIAKDLKKGLQSRWKYADENDDSISTMTSWEQYGDYIRKCIKKELSELKKYTKNKEYEYSETKELILSYVDILNNQSEVTEGYVSDYIKSNYNYNIYNTKRGITLNKLVKKLDIEFDTASYKEAYKGVIEASEDHLENKTLVSDAVKVEKIIIKDSSPGYVEGKIRIKNLTNISLDLVSVNIRLYDKKKVVLQDIDGDGYNLEPYQTMYVPITLAKSNVQKIEATSYTLSYKGDDGIYYNYNSDVPFSKTITKDL